MKTVDISKPVAIQCGNEGHTRVADRHDPASRAVALFNSRWTIAAAGTVLMMVLGTVYSWSLFTRPLIAAFHWSTTMTMWGFSIAIFSLGIGAIVGGRLQDRIGPRRVALIGALLWGGGNLLAGLLTAHLGVVWLYLTYGVIGGFGLGMGYISPVAMVTKWFPDRPGFASGLVLTGFGLGAFIYNVILSAIPGFAHAVKSAGTGALSLAPADVNAVTGTFAWSGVCFMVIGVLCAALLRNPPHGYGRRVADPANISVRHYRPSEVLRTPQFYMLWLMLFFSVTAGVLIISNAVPLFSDLTGMPALIAAPLCGCLSIFNGLGRVAWGHISDRMGRRGAYALILSSQALVFAVLSSLHAPFAVAIAFGIVLFCNGGSFGTMPAFNADFFGTKYLGMNYGMILTAWGCAGVVGPMLAARVKDLTGSFSGTLIPVAAMLLVATMLPLLAHKPGVRSRKPQPLIHFDGAEALIGA